MTEPDAVADRLVGEIAALLRLLKRVGATVGGATDSASFPVLARLATEGPRRSGELASVMCADPSTVSRQVAGLVKAGLVERRADPEDGRASLLAVTEAGDQALAEQRRIRAEHLSEALGDWTPQARADLADLLGRFVTDLQRKYERDPR